MEDEAYRASTQFRFWSFPKAKLEEIRRGTHKFAAEKVNATSVTQAARSNGSPYISEVHVPIQPLSLQEEMLIVEMSSEKIMQMGESVEPRVPSSITATAIQYVRRFYLNNSAMTCHPRQIIACALFLAMKANHFYKSLHDFLANLDNITETDVRASEFLLMQGLRFTLDVRHPMRGLEGGVMDIQALIDSDKLGHLPRQDFKSLSQRVTDAANQAKYYLRTAAQMTDAYFIYTPSQIWLGALYAVDDELVARYIEHICTGPKAEDLPEKLLPAIRACAELLASYKPARHDAQKEKDMRRAARKLRSFQNLEDFNTAAFAEAKVVEKTLKKRRLDREKTEKDDDVFGPVSDRYHNHTN